MLTLLVKQFICCANRPQQTLFMDAGWIWAVHWHILQMNVVILPQFRPYWIKLLRFSRMADTMTRMRLESIKLFLLCNDSQATTDDTDKLYKVRPFLEALTAKFTSTTHVEQLIVFQRVISSSMKTYNPKKSAKWAIKCMFCLGPMTWSIIGNFTLAKFSLDLDKQILMLRTSYFKNRFTSPNMQTCLWKKGIAAMETARLNWRLHEIKTYRKKEDAAFMCKLQ